MMQTTKPQFQYARSLIEASLDPLVTISPEGKITDMNEALTSITGRSREELVDTFFYSYFTEPQKARDVYQDIFAKGSVSDHLLTIRNATLTEVLFNGSIYKDEQGIVIGAVVVARDVTGQRRIEAELIEARVFAELATTIAEQAKEKAESATQTAEEATLIAEKATRTAEEATLIAETATRSAEEAVKSKQQFLSNMSHEIRTPMNAILGFTKVLLKTQIDPRQREYLDAIKTSGDALIVLINDILDLAKVDAGKMTFEYVPFRLSESISAMLHLFELKIEEKNLQLIRNYDDRIPLVLVGDPVRLHQIILNLVSNAVKFTSEGNITVSIQLLSEDEDKTTIEFAVADTGIGIQPERLGGIFENFQQASSGTARLYGGTGLGLAIVKQLIEPQGGSVSVISEPDKGSTFSFILDFRKTTFVPELEIESVTPSSLIKDISVLVVEDIALNQLLMQTLLDEFGFQCEIAGNGKVAIEKMATKTYDVILMDLQMPELNGFEATQYIRNTLRLTTPIIALTADVTTVDLAKCKAVGMNDYISKPVNERLLFAKIVSVVQKSVVQKAVIESITEPAVRNSEVIRCTNLEYLMQRTKGRPDLAMKMIGLFVEQTPTLIKILKQSMLDKNWPALQSAAHKMIPSFAIVGMKPDFEFMANRIQHFAGNQIQVAEVESMIMQLEVICKQACKELEEDFNKMNTPIYE
jgi:PAS domain S-box-containing protein